MVRRTDGRCDTGIQILPPAGQKFGPRKICHQARRAASTRSAEHSIPLLVLRLLPEGRSRSWLANQPTSQSAPPPNAHKDGSVQAALVLSFACLGPRRSSNLVPILGTLIDVRRSTFELALQIDRSVPPGGGGHYHAVPCCVDPVHSGHLPLPPECFVAETSCLCERRHPTVAGLILNAL